MKKILKELFCLPYVIHFEIENPFMGIIYICAVHLTVGLTTATILILFGVSIITSLLAACVAIIWCSFGYPVMVHSILRKK